MKNLWLSCHNVLCIRVDNMGDLLMSVPAIRALKESFHCKITLLTSTLAHDIVKYITEIDEVIMYDVPWVKGGEDGATSFFDIVSMLKQHRFDAAVIFTVFSQNPLPAALLAFLAGIPLRLAYCRENPYHLLTDWVAEKEPYTFIRHQVKRDLDLVANVGATTNNEHLSLYIPENEWPNIQERMIQAGIDITKPWLIMHPEVSEKKREYPQELWIKTAKKIISELHYQIIITGTASSNSFSNFLREKIGKDIFSFAGLLDIGQFITLIHHAPLVISVNTATVHIASATGTPIVVLYALTNPQHTPWKCPAKVLFFDIPEQARSRNEVLKYLYTHVFDKPVSIPGAEDIINAVQDLLGQS